MNNNATSSDWNEIVLDVLKNNCLSSAKVKHEKSVTPSPRVGVTNQSETKTQKLTSQNLQRGAWFLHHTKDAFSCTTLRKAFTIYSQACYSHIQDTARACPLQHVCLTFCFAFSAITCAYTRTCVASMWSLVYFLARTTKRVSNTVPQRGPTTGPHVARGQNF